MTELVATNVELNDQQIDKFFESGGEVELAASEQDSNAEQQQQELKQEEIKQEEQQQQQEQQTDQQKEHERNYRAAMHEERERRKQIEAELRDTKIRMQRMEEIWHKMQTQAQGQNQPAIEIPDYEQDPMGHLRVKQALQEQYLQQQAEYLQQQYQRAQLEYQKKQLLQKYATDAQIFKQQTPDFLDAYKFLFESRKKEYLAARFSLDKTNELIEEDELAIAINAYEQNVNPAEIIYAIAKERGYRPAAQQQTQTTNTQATAEQKIAQVQKGLQASKSLSYAGGKTQTPLSLEALAEMDDESFDKFWDKVIQAG
jgi:hypothetical protein